MAAVLEKKDPAAPFASQVEEQIAQATNRIRAHDLAFGALLLVSLALIYTTAMIVLDKTLALPDWVRQASLAGFLAVLAGVAYFRLVRPMRKRINPLYAAKQVEQTIDDNKNSVTGYVDAQEKGDLNPTVKAALASRAAKAAAEADVNRAVDHRSLIYVGGVATAFLLTLIVLFFVFRPAQFASLVNRTFNPFSSSVIESQTQITIDKPNPVDPTITTGQSITVAVTIGGKVPKADSPQRVRLLIRHNPADPNYDELPLVQGDTSRNWELRVPDYLVQNGFWYKVAAGDAVTPEYRVTVRSLPMFTDFQVTYEYPQYLRLKNDITNDPAIRAYRGTKVTLLARTNREVRDGIMVVDPGNVRVPGVPVPGKPDSLKFEFKVTESGRYKLTFNSAAGETTPDNFAAVIKVDVDRAPQIVINKPEDVEMGEIQLPANGQLVIDGKVGDDFGIDTVTLKMKVVEPANLHRELPDVPYLNGKSTSFRREKDGTFPTDLDYKGSVDLAKVTKDAAKLDIKLEPDMVIEFWLEATDNCTEPKPNVGRSLPKRVRLTAPKTEPMDKQQLDQQKQERRNEEQKHNDQQKQKNDTEKRERNQNPNQQQQNNEQKTDKTDPKVDQKQPGDPKPDAGKQPDPKPNDPNPTPEPKQTGPKTPEPKSGDPKSDDKKGNANPMGMDMGDPMSKSGDAKQKGDEKGGMGQPKNDDQKNVENTAKDFEKQIDQENKNGGSGKPNPTPKEEDRAEPGKPKPQPKDGMGGDTGTTGMNKADTKPEPKQPNPKDPMNPMGKNDSSPSQSKPEGKLEKGQDTATPKPEQPKQPDGMNGQKGGAPPSEKRDEPIGVPPPGTEKDPPKEPQPAPKDQNQKQDPGSGSTAKPASEKPQGGDPSGMPNDKKDPAAEAGTGPKPPMRDPTRGSEKPPAQQKGPVGPNDPKEPPAEGKPEGDPKAGDAKPEKAPPAGNSKPKPSEDMMNAGMGPNGDPKPSGDANDPKKPNGTGAADAKPDNKQGQPMGAGEKSVEKSTEKPQPKDEKGDRTAGGDKGDNKKLDPAEMKKLEEAAKNLNSPDPQKRDAARETLDKAIGEDKRKELEQLQKDLNSPDDKTREAAQQKLEKMAQDAKDKQAKDTGTTGGKKNDKGDNPSANGQKIDEKQQKELAEAVKDLESSDPKKKQDAQQKLDKAIGEQNRKEIEQTMNDLKSDDKDKRAAAQKKLDDFKKEIEKQARKDKDGKGDDTANGKKLDEQQAKELAEAVKDLQSNDPKKKQDAREKLDKMVGEQNRKEAEQMMDDLKSPDKSKREAAEKKLDDLKKEIEKQARKDGKGDPKGKEPSPEEIDKLAKSAQDLNSKDDKKREEAEKELDAKIGEENRKKLQEELKNKKPELQQQAKDLKQKMEEWQQGLGRGTPNSGPMDDDKKNRAKTAELNLENFQKDEYRKKLQASKGWTDAEYDDFLNKYKKYVENLKNDAAAASKPDVAPMPGEGGRSFGSLGGSKVEPTGPGTAGNANVGGPTVAPPGFEDAKRRFEDALKKKR